MWAGDIMDWVTLGGVLTTIGAILAIFVQLHRDKKEVLNMFLLLSKDFTQLSDGHSQLSKEHSQLSKEHDKLESDLSGKIVSERIILSELSRSVKSDTQYISDEMKMEKMARQKLYENSSRAKEILETMDMMKEVIHQNAILHKENTMLKGEKELLQEEKALLQYQNRLQRDSTSASDYKDVIQLLRTVKGQLASLEGMQYVEEIQSVLKKIEGSLSEYNNKG